MGAQYNRLPFALPEFRMPFGFSGRAGARATLCVALALMAGIASALTSGVAHAQATQTRVRIDTNLGSFIVELEDQRAPLTTANFLQYVRSGFYAGTIFHRVIGSFIAQGGGYDEKYQLKTPLASVPNESGNGLSNRRWTVGLARTESPHSGNAQFFVNLGDNEDLDPNPLRWGYAVFGKVVDGLDVLDRIAHSPTGSAGPWQKDVPVEPIVIRGMQVIGEPMPSATPAASSPAAAPASPAAAPGAAPAKPPVKAPAKSGS
jgi:peptidyl-prolyl cis-trans isomerase A (cyclophilin A)